MPNTHSDSECQYSDVIHHHEIITVLLKQSVTRLDKIRLAQANAAGLIVAATIEHARVIQTLLRALGEVSIVVTSKDQDAQQRITNFKYNQDKWIIAVGMISEGTNIPRLSVCCYLSVVTTELYFRQVLGRILRRQSILDETGFLIMPAHPTLVKYARRVFDDIPEEQNIFLDIIESNINKAEMLIIPRERIEKVAEHSLMVINAEHNTLSGSNYRGGLEQWYNSHIEALGHYKSQIIAL